ncbi:MAG: LysM peptidoglycan-binding domain-containing M23 family metallopeptidase [Synergistaceae bacterium]|nr:LysM peptidoglycan-binding domain-containing M23 family metallopeptidase [Synergistaceae bacterium]
MRDRSDRRIINRKNIYLALFLLFSVGSAVVCASVAAERAGMYWIGLDSELATERPEDNRGFFTVDVSDFLSAGTSQAEASEEETEVVPLAIGPLPSIPTLTDEELKLYKILTKNDGLISSSDQTELNQDIHWTEVVLEPGETLKSISEEYNISEEDIRQANGLRKNEKPNPSEVLYVPDSHEDVVATLLFVRKLQKEEVELAKRGQLLEVREYTVKAGDTLWGVAAKFNLDVDTLVGSNIKALGSDIDRLKLDMKLRIPNQDGVFVTVAKNDSVSKLADKYGSTKESILLANAMKSDALIAGDEIFLPGGKYVANSEVRISTKTKKGVRTATVKLSGGASQSFRWPAIGRITSGFGWRRSPFGRRRVFHSGLDIAAPRGTTIRAASAGVVVHSGWMGGYGRTIVLSHSKGVTTLYGHCSKLLVKSGTKVSRGQTIALVGSTGRSTGNHLHFEVRVGGTPVNPLKHLR